MTDALTEVADQLYALPPQRFVAERDAAVAAARERGDRSAAAAIGKLRRPTVSAWLVNLLAMRRPELLADLIELAAALRAAQRDLDGDQLRELTTRRRAAVSGLVATARTLALEVEPSLSGKLPLAEVETTLSAALGDASAAEQVRSGRLVRAVVPEGFGELPRVRLRLVTDDTDEARAAAEPEAGDQAGRVTPEAVAAALAEAESAAASADVELGRVTAAQREAKQALAEIDARLAELAARRAGVAGELAGLDAAEFAARQAVAAARRRVGEVEAVGEEMEAKDN